MATTFSPEDHGASASGVHAGRGDQDKSPLGSLNLGFLKSLDKRTVTRGEYTQPERPCMSVLLISLILFLRWQPAQTTRAQAGQQAGTDPAPGAEPTSAEVSLDVLPPCPLDP